MTALVLAGGGVAGIAWELGVLRGLQDADPSLADRVLAADLIIGTSAGSAVAAQITSGAPLDELYRAQLSRESAEIEVDLDMDELLARFAAAVADVAGEQETRRAIGTVALETKTVTEGVRRAAIAARLPVPAWPERPMMLPAVDAATGEPVVFTKDSDVALVDAVAASCAVPGVWPPVTIAGRRYIDGGVRSSTNADLAAGHERILVIVPSLEGQPDPFSHLDAEVAQLAPSEVAVIYADAASISAFGTNPLSPLTRPAAARAGRDVGRAAAKRITSFWP
ncbi:MAG TPA: patatin-like phospholipase family protein [Micromonosporaceae bacterium]|jgi:NTE family protein